MGLFKSNVNLLNTIVTTKLLSQVIFLCAKCKDELLFVHLIIYLTTLMFLFPGNTTTFHANVPLDYSWRTLRS